LSLFFLLTNPKSLSGDPPFLQQAWIVLSVSRLSTHRVMLSPSRTALVISSPPLCFLSLRSWLARLWHLEENHPTAVRIGLFLPTQTPRVVDSHKPSHVSKSPSTFPPSLLTLNQTLVIAQPNPFLHSAVCANISSRVISHCLFFMTHAVLPPS